MTILNMVGVTIAFGTVPTAWAVIMLRKWEDEVVGSALKLFVGIYTALEIIMFGLYLMTL